ncbi:MAG TPA: hypothetical protein VM450_19840, partial [Thermomicrobiales bacterium]|nr:hypothetical protein [Thermomicrobiales bacterium]
MAFEYVIAADHDANATLLGRDTGAAAGAPLVGVVAPLGSDGRADLPDRASFVLVSHPDVEVSHLAPSRTDRRLTIFLVSHANEPVETVVTIAHLPFSRVQTGTFLETDLADVPSEDGAVSVTLAPGEMRTLVLTTG